MIRREGMRAQVKEGNVRALFSEDSVEMGHYDGTRAEGVIGHAFRFNPERPKMLLYRTTTTCWDLTHSKASFPEELIELPMGSFRQ